MRTTRSQPCPSLHFDLNRSRINRLIRLRRTAEGSTRLLIVMPKRAWPESPGCQWIANHSPVWGRLLSICENPSRRAMRYRRGKVRLFTGSHAKTGTTASAASGDDGAAALGLHADQEAVGTLSLGDGGLESALHALLLSILLIEKRAITIFCANSVKYFYAVDNFWWSL